MIWSQIRFLVDGSRATIKNIDRTVGELGIEDGEEIDVFPQRLSGVGERGGGERGGGVTARRGGG